MNHIFPFTLLPFSEISWKVLEGHDVMWSHLTGTLEVKTERYDWTGEKTEYFEYSKRKIAIFV